jgi:hypothetical protein
VPATWQRELIEALRRSFMLRGLQCLVDYFEAQEWLYDLDEEEGCLDIGFEESNGSYRGLVEVDEGDDALQFYSFFPTKIPSKRRVAVAELLVRANYRLKLGSFDMNLDEGEILFRTSLLYRGDIPSEVIEELISFNMWMMDHHHPAILEVAFGGKRADVALAELEASEADDEDEPEPD